MSQLNASKKSTALIIKVYPVALILISLALNLTVFSVEGTAIALPSHHVLAALAIASLLLVLNHTWLMTSTELTRLKYEIRATPEEWKTSGLSKGAVTETGFSELERRHNAHRNATENTTLFVLLAIPFSFVSPSALAASVWLIGFAIGRLGHTYSFLTGKSGARGLFMTVSLLCLYGLAGYTAIALLL
ncbi:MAPEG family protein [uncultured Roseibium sp.]|uniref:MAPEG family protein n=1 Tax=uncultured Roseibium sp. TaxID=1936171 RepID=UPI002630A91A|nr:MAPEG family protein [uncultured Roseibium sp.]